MDIKIWIKENAKSLGLVAFVCFLVYANSLGNGFVSDDIGIITQNPDIGSLKYVFSNPFSVVGPLIYYLTFNLFGLNPSFFRFGNIIFHIANSLLVFFIFKEIFKFKYSRFWALVFALHPILTESISWISGGPYARYTTFVLLSFVILATEGSPESKCRSWTSQDDTSSKHNGKKLFLSLLFFLLALESSEKAAVLPLIIFAYELHKRSSIKEIIKRTFPYFALLLIWIVPFYFLRVGQRAQDIAGYNPYSNSSINIFYLVPVAITEYLKLIFWPKALTLYHSEMFFTATQLYLRVIVIFGLLLSTVFLYKKKSPAFFFISLFVISLLPTLLPFGFSWIVAERYVYLGTIGIIGAVGVVVETFPYLSQIPQKILIPLTTLLLLLPLSIRTIARNANWKSHDTLWLATAKYSPNSSQNHNNLGDYYGRHGNNTKALDEFKRAVELKPDYSDAYHNLGNTYLALNKIENAKESYKKAIEFNPTLWQSYQNLGAIYFQQGDYLTANGYFEKSLQINPGNENLRKVLDAMETNK